MNLNDPVSKAKKGRENPRRLGGRVGVGGGQAISVLFPGIKNRKRHRRKA